MDSSCLQSLGVLLCVPQHVECNELNWILRPVSLTSFQSRQQRWCDSAIEILLWVQGLQDVFGGNALCSRLVFQCFSRVEDFLCHFCLARLQCLDVVLWVQACLIKVDSVHVCIFSICIFDRIAIDDITHIHTVRTFLHDVSIEEYMLHLCLRIPTSVVHKQKLSSFRIPVLCFPEVIVANDWLGWRSVHRCRPIGEFKSATHAIHLSHV